MPPETFPTFGASRPLDLLSMNAAAEPSSGGLMKIYVGNLANTTTAEQLQELFAGFGQVVSAELAKDRRTGETRGFGFIEMPCKAEAHAAITGLDLKPINGRSMTVNEAKSPPAGRRERRF
jgi:RNA recognition motif-containing protein